MMRASRGVMKNHLRINRGRVCLFLMLLAFPPTIAGQERTYQSGSYNGRTHAIDEANSRAAQEAERLVSLSADKIILLLQQEPGLLLQVKKMLVRKAYEQGRLLDSQDLTDEALFRLLRRDENIRVLATREIVDRQYVRVKPTREELERERPRNEFHAFTGNRPQEEEDGKAGGSQEDAYWSQRDFDLLAPTVPQFTRPQPLQPVPQVPSDSRREKLLAQAQSQSGDSNTGLPLGVTGMEQVSPDQLSALLSARMEDRSPMSPQSQLSMASLVSGTASTGNANPYGGGPPSVMTTPILDPSQTEEPAPTQEARLENRSRPPLQPLPSTRRDQPMLSR